MVRHAESLIAKIIKGKNILLSIDNRPVVTLAMAYGENGGNLYLQIIIYTIEKFIKYYYVELFDIV